MLDHFGFIVSDLAVARRFYEAALAPLGLSVVEEQPEAFIMARKGQPLPFIYIGAGRPTFWSEASVAGGSPAHFGFRAADRAAVDTARQGVTRGERIECGANMVGKTAEQGHGLGLSSIEKSLARAL